MSNALTEHIDRVNKTDSTVFLGRLTWYTVSGMRVSHAQVVQGLASVGLGSHLPPIPKDFDVFRRVSSNAQIKKVPVPNEAGVFENYLIREVAGRGDTVVTRRIVVEKVDRKGKRLDYRQLRDIDFNKDTSAITIREVNDPIAGYSTSSVDVTHPTAAIITKNIRDEFIAWRGMLNSYAIREFIRKMVCSWGATCVRDGVYFLPEDKAAEVESMETFVNNLPGDAMFHSMPLVDDRKQREMIKRAFQAETSDAIDQMMVEIDELQANTRGISTDRYAKILTDYQNLTSKTTEYGELLETELGESHSRLSLFQVKIVNLKARVKA